MRTHATIGVTAEDIYRNDSIYMKCPKQTKPWRLGVGEEGSGMTSNGPRVSVCLHHAPWNSRKVGDPWTGAS